MIVRAGEVVVVLIVRCGVLGRMPEAPA
jgi:hypothetical protein